MPKCTFSYIKKKITKEKKNGKVKQIVIDSLDKKEVTFFNSCMRSQKGVDHAPVYILFML